MSRDLDNEWSYIPMPIDKDGRGPCEKRDTVRTVYEVWDCVNMTVAVCDYEDCAKRIVEDHNRGLAE